MKKRIAVLALLAACLLLGGCGAKSTSDSTTAMYSTDTYSTIAEEKGETYDFAANSAAPEAGVYNTAAGAAGSNEPAMSEGSRKVVLTADVNLESQTYDTALSAVLDAVEQGGGYVQSREDYAYGARSSALTLRIPAGGFDAFLTQLKSLANVTYLSQNAQDITDSYIETQSYIDSLTIQQTRLLELLAQAETLQDTLDIEDRLATVRGNLEYYASLKNAYDAQTSYATVMVSLNEVKDYTIAEPTFGERLLETLRSSGRGFVSFLQNTLLTLLYLLPYLVIAAVIVVVIVRLRRRKKQAEKAQTAEKTETDESAEDPQK